MERHNDVCILGGGPAALMAQILLRRKGVDSCVIADAILGSLRPMEVEGQRLSPVPIFISTGSALFGKMDWGAISSRDTVTTRHSPTSHNDAAENIHPGSYAEFMVQHYPDAARRLIITRKHLGTDAFRQNFPGLCRKVLAHHPVDGRIVERVGFCAGVSLYLHFIEREPIQSIGGAVLSIDTARKVVTTSSDRISYDRLISTLPLLEFLSLARIPTTLTTYAAGAQLVVARAKGPVTPNDLIYDCDAASSVHRVFVPCEGYVIIQVARPDWGVEDDVMARRVQVLFDHAEPPAILRKFTLQACYPLAVSDYAQRDALIDELEGLGVTLFGRFAEWEYRDIEELNWERIECVS